MARESAGVIWVCVDCLFAREGDGTENPDREPWNLFPATEVSLGMLWEEHENPTECEKSFRTGGECDCERMDFSWHACDACGSTLGGERQAYTLWV
jgi:hypothetical protein